MNLSLFLVIVCLVLLVKTRSKGEAIEECFLTTLEDDFLIKRALRAL